MKKNEDRHPLWNEPMEEAKGLFFPYFEGQFDDGDERERLESYIEVTEKKLVLKTIKQLKKIIDSDMDDKEIDDFLELKLGANWIADRKWLVDVRDYIQRRTNEIEAARPEKDRLYDADMTELQNFINNYYCNLLKNIASAEQEHEVLDLYRDESNDEELQKTIDQLTYIIDSGLNDKDVEDLIAMKLKSDFLPEAGQSCAWLSRIRDYLNMRS